MPDFETVTCTTCGNDFKTISGAAAAETEYCSPTCHSAGENLV